MGQQPPCPPRGVAHWRDARIILGSDFCALKTPSALVHAAELENIESLRHRIARIVEIFFQRKPQPVQAVEPGRQGTSSLSRFRCDSHVRVGLHLIVDDYLIQQKEHFVHGFHGLRGMSWNF